MNPAGRIPLSTIAHGRSGDKGNHANVAVIAYTAAGFDWLQKNLSADRVRKYFAGLGAGRVLRHEVPNLWALNFVLYDVLAGGASRSLRIDTQGKTLALALLQMEIDPPENLAALERLEKTGTGPLRLGVLSPFFEAFLLRPTAKDKP